MKKKDIIAGVIIGEAIAWLLFLIASNIVSNPDEGKTIAPIFAIAASYAGLFVLTIGFPLATLFGLWVATRIAGRIPILYQLAKFVLVGVLNTLIDIGVLNLMIFLTHIRTGYPIPVFAALGFVAALVNSYAWNKLWTFENTETTAITKEFQSFFIVSLVGLALNVGTVHVVVNVITAPADVNQVVWDNLAKILGSIASLIWNFVGYKFFVFKKKDNPEASLSSPAIQ
ncbi:MAG: GtrA family protein [Parcubacteria group bacterium]|nr:GtrA family protein [Parcubacteria group bacterium]